jgi:transcriptional regulator with XRE-family HTH domain
VDQIRDLGFWRQFGEALRRIRQRRRLSLRECAQATELCAEDLLNVEVRNIFTTYEQFLKNEVTPAGSANDSTFLLIASEEPSTLDSALPGFLQKI